MPHLWIRGSLAGLTLALAFSVVLNVLVLGTLVWPAWLETRLKLACAATAAVLWIAALWETRGELRRLAAERDAAESDDPPKATNHNDAGAEWLRAAQTHYLREDWVQAEKLLRKAIRRDRDDFESRLWLVAVLRRAGRPHHAERLLRRVEGRDAAAGWRTEVADERRRLDEALAADSETPVILPIRQSDTTAESRPSEAA